MVVQVPYLLDVYFFRMEFTQHLDQYEHARCVETFQWKCLIYSVEAPDQVGLKCSILAKGSSTLMVSTKRSGCVAINAKRLSICAVSLKRKKKTSNSPSCAGLMSVGSNLKFKQVIKQVTFSFLVVRQKTTAKKIRRAKDGRIIPPARKQVLEGVVRNSYGR